MTAIHRARCLVPLALLAAAIPAAAEEAITVTATRLPEPAISLPLVIASLPNDTLRARGAVDLRDALAGVAGVQANPGGDMGPAGAVVAFQGLAEMDAYLLVVDGVPFGGAFNPAVTTLDLIDVERFEVLKGAAPVTYGATSFVGVLNAVRYDAGEQPTRLLVQGGTRSSARGSFATTIAKGQSLLGSAETRRFSQDRGGFERYHLLYRARADTAGRVHFDLEGVSVDQTPYSPHPREGNVLTPRFPRDANVNPTDARQDQDRLQANLGLDARLGELDWVTLASVAQNWGRNTRGFLREGFASDGITINADGFRQRVRTTEGYLDSHIGHASATFDWIAGVDLLYGRGSQRSSNFEYAVRPDGSNAPTSTSRTIDESTVLTDHRVFGGLYGQVVARPVPGLTLLGGLRLNRTSERRCGGEAEGDTRPDADDCHRRSKTRLAGSAGASYAVWSRGDDSVALFGDYRDTYKPAAIDFGPEAEGDILAPETTRSWEGGIKTRAAGGRVALEASYFETRFNNLVIRENIGGLPGLASAGKSRLRGFEVELRATPFADFTLSAGYAHHLAQFVDYARLRPDGSIQQLAGKRLELSPKDLASGVASYAPATGVQASATLRYTGKRFLNKGNTSVAGAYADLDARLGWRWSGGWGVFVESENITDRRDAVVESELGDAQFYRLPGRRLLLTIERRL